MKRPLQVYLDSSDFSILSNSKTRTPEVIKVEQALHTWQDKGLIELRFSHIHVIEAAPLAPQFLPSSKNRFLYIKENCGRKCLISYVTIMEEEVKRLDPSKHFNFSNRLNNQATWYPELDLDLPDFVSLHHEEIAGLPNREARRAAKKKTMNKTGGFSRSMLQSLAESAPKKILDFSDKFPLTDYAKKLCLEYIKGNVSKEGFGVALADSMSDLACLSEWYQKQWDRIIPISSFMREIGEDTKNSLLLTTENFNNQADKYQSLGIDEKTFTAEKNRLFDELLISIPANLTTSISKKLGFDILTKNIGWETTPSLLTAVNISVHLSRKTALATKSPRTPKTSDIADSFHALYLPHVDIFRTDSTVASTISELKLPFNTMVVANFMDLPEAIESRLNDKR